MGSALISTWSRETHGEESRPPDELRLADTRLRTHLVWVAMFSLPFIALALYTQSLGVLSEPHARVLAKALAAADRGRLEVLGFVYPPLPFLLTSVWPSALTLVVLAGVTTGATAWILWYDLRRSRLPLVVRAILLITVLLVPSMLFLATQCFPEMLALHLFLVAWHYHLNFVRSGHTWSGFLAGLVLGLAFFASFYAVIFALAFALSSPIYSRLAKAKTELSLQADVARMLVIFFPAIWSLLSWCYLNWVFTGDPFSFLRHPVPTVSIPNASGTVADVVQQALRQTGAELLHQPLFLAVAALNISRSPLRVVPFLSVPLMLTCIRLVGFTVGELFVLGLYGLTALSSVPRQVPLRWGVLLVAFAVLQFSMAAVPQRHVVAEWPPMVRLGGVLIDQVAERELGHQLARAGSRAILADDHRAYRVIAHTGSARPFLLPVDAEFSSALAEPHRHVAYVLVAAGPADPFDRVSTRFADRPPAGFVLDGRWDGWVLYRRSDVPSLVSGARQ
jgi:hypothetical protein